MLVLKKFNAHANLIQLIIGPETFEQLSIVGILCLDLDAILAQIPESKTRKNVLAITRTECEQSTAAFINDGGMNNLPHPLNAEGGPAIASTDASTPAPTAEVAKPMPQVVTPKNDPRGMFVTGLKCTKCGEPGSFVKTGEVPKCSTCIKIDTELAKQRQSPAE